MGHTKIAAMLIAIIGVAATFLTGVNAGPTWAIGVGTASIVAAIFLTSFAVIRQAQRTHQRLAQIRSQSTSIDRTTSGLETLGGQLVQEITEARAELRAARDHLTSVLPADAWTRRDAALDDLADRVAIQLAELQRASHQHERALKALTDHQMRMDQRLSRQSHALAEKLPEPAPITHGDIETILEHSSSARLQMNSLVADLGALSERQKSLDGMLDVLEAEVTGRLDQMADELQHGLNLLDKRMQGVGESSAQASKESENRLSTTWGHLVDDIQSSVESIQSALKANTTELAHHTTETASEQTSLIQLSLTEQRQGFEAWNQFDPTRLERQLGHLERDIYFNSYQIPREIEASQQLYKHLTPERLMPATGGWALSPLGMLAIVRTILNDEPSTVVECGSGTSTVWMALALKSVGSGHLYALEHDVKHVARTNTLLNEHGVADFATVLHAPLTPLSTEDDGVTWYDPSVLDGLSDVGVALIDGPPAAVTGGRSHSLKYLRRHLAQNAWVFIDDYHRPEEKRMVEEWLDSHPELTLEYSETKLQAVLHWSSGR